MSAKKEQGIAFDVSELAEGEPMPETTIGGIMQRIDKVRSAARVSSGRRQQCPSVFTSGKRSVSLTFCTLDEGHEGEHRGFRKRWPNESEGGAG